MSVLLDSRPHAEAVKAAVSAELGKWSAYDYGDVPGADGNAGTLPAIFALVSAERRYNPNLRMSGQTGTVGWRVTVRTVGRTADECRWALWKVATALHEQTLAVGGGTTTPAQLESEQAPELDDGRHSAVAVYTYCL